MTDTETQPKRRTYFITGRFTAALGPDEEQSLRESLAAQLDDVELHSLQLLSSPFEASDHYSDLAGETSVQALRRRLQTLGLAQPLPSSMWWAAYDFLHELVWELSTALRQATGRGDAAWLALDAGSDLVRSDLGTMRISDLRAYHNEGVIG